MRDKSWGPYGPTAAVICLCCGRQSRLRECERSLPCGCSIDMCAQCRTCRNSCIHGPKDGKCGRHCRRTPKEMPERWLRALALAEHGMSTREIGAALGVTRQTASDLLCRARRRQA
jgi:hypothetical protein